MTLQIGKSDFGLLKSNAPDYNQMRRIFDLIRIMFSEDYRKKEERGCAFIGTASPQIPI